MKTCNFPPHYTTYSGSGISCPACGRYDDAPDVRALPADFVRLHQFDLFSELVGAAALLLSVLVLAAFLVGGSNR